MNVAPATEWITLWTAGDISSELWTSPPSPTRLCGSLWTTGDGGAQAHRRLTSGFVLGCTIHRTEEENETFPRE